MTGMTSTDLSVCLRQYSDNIFPRLAAEAVYGTRHLGDLDYGTVNLAAVVMAAAHVRRMEFAMFFPAQAVFNIDISTDALSWMLNGIRNAYADELRDIVAARTPVGEAPSETVQLICARYVNLAIRNDIAHARRTAPGQTDHAVADLASGMLTAVWPDVDWSAAMDPARNNDRKANLYLRDVAWETRLRLAHLPRSGVTPDAVREAAETVIRRQPYTPSEKGGAT